MKCIGTHYIPILEFLIYLDDIIYLTNNKLIMILIPFYL